MAGYALDAGAISAIRVTGLSVADWVGDADVSISVVAFGEVQRGLPPDDRKYIGNLVIAASVPAELTDVTPQIRNLAETLIARYARHAPPLAANDAFIAADAIGSGRILITKNTRDFHYIDGLMWIDANGFQPATGSLVQTRAAVAAARSSRPCCSRLLRHSG